MAEPLRRIAEQITADLGYHGGWQAQQVLTDAIEAALKAERERAAKLMEAGSDGVGGDWGCDEAAAAIRNEDTK